MKMFLFFSLVIGLTFILSGTAVLFGFGLHTIGGVMQQPKAAKAFRQNMQKTSLFDLFVGKGVQTSNPKPSPKMK
ncbi:MAG: hypothetical protein VST68_11295 [Nitrospirota bacterium]|nr:hypothetical protein [Nitrospirota bacterium]